jgi:disulfide bond formation protein DsbB
MRSFAGLYNPALRLRIALAAIALAAIAVSLLLAFASVSLPRSTTHAPRAAVEVPIAAAPQQRSERPAVSGPGTSNEGAAPALLWALLTPWALAVSAIAVLGFIAARLWRR